jgi:hypothetical protein
MPILTLQTRLRPNKEEVAAKVMDGEAIMINLTNGTYYSMDGVGGAIWELVESERSLQEIAAAIAARYDVAQVAAQADVENLAAQLVEENLAHPYEGEIAQQEPPAEQESKLPYAAPSLVIYRDMADLLALDPPMPGFQEPTWRDPD